MSTHTHVQGLQDFLSLYEVLCLAGLRQLFAEFPTLKIVLGYTPSNVEIVETGFSPSNFVFPRWYPSTYVRTVLTHH